MPTVLYLWSESHRLVLLKEMCQAKLAECMRVLTRICFATRVAARCSDPCRSLVYHGPKLSDSRFIHTISPVDPAKTASTLITMKKYETEFREIMQSDEY